MDCGQLQLGTELGLWAFDLRHTGGGGDFLLATRPRSSAVEHVLGKDEVTGSSPVVGSKRDARVAKGNGL